MKLLVTAVFLIAAPAIFAAEAQPPTTAPSNTRYALRDVRITWSRADPRPGNVDQFFGKVPQELGSRILGIPPEKLLDVFSYDMRGSDDRCDIHMRVTLPETAKPAAREFLDELTAAIGKWASEQTNKQIRRPSLGRDEAEARLEQATATARKVRNEISARAGRADATPATITSALTKLEDAKQTLELDQLAKRARAEALAKQLSEQADKIQAQVNSDAIVAELQKVVDARDERLDQVRRQQKSGLAAPPEVQDAVATAAEARAKLLQRKRDAAAEAGGASLEALNRELTLLSVDLRELDARLEYVQKHLPGLQRAMDQLDSLERAQSDLQHSRAEFEKADTRYRDAERALSTTDGPSVIVLQSKSLPQPPKANQNSD